MSKEKTPKRERATWPGDPADEPQKRHERELAEEKKRREKSQPPTEEEKE